MKSGVITFRMTETMKEYKPSQTDRSVLEYYPPETGNRKIEDIKSER